MAACGFPVLVDEERLPELDITGSKMFIYHLFKQEHINKVHAIIVLGGDGTLLWSARSFKSCKLPPIISFQMGTLSYLCEFEVQEYSKVLNAFLLTTCTTKDYNLMKHNANKYGYTFDIKPRISCTLVEKGSPKLQVKTLHSEIINHDELIIDKVQAVNEIVIDRVYS